MGQSGYRMKLVWDGLGTGQREYWMGSVNDEVSMGWSGHRIKWVCNGVDTGCSGYGIESVQG